MKINDQDYALPLSCVRRVVRVVEITDVPNTPGGVLGVIDVQGEVIPVIDPRKVFNLPERGIQLSDQLVLVETSEKTAALLVDSVDGVVERSREETAVMDEILPEVPAVDAVTRSLEGLILISDIDAYLSQAGQDSRESINETREKK